MLNPREHRPLCACVLKRVDPIADAVSQRLWTRQAAPSWILVVKCLVSHEDKDSAQKKAIAQIHEQDRHGTGDCFVCS
jgi:hypothetical protein